MGDRRNVKIVEHEGGVINLYTHWEGYKLREKVQAALAKFDRERWDDESYLTRIIFDTMTEGKQGEETGFGISTWPAQDAGYPPVEVWVEEQKVKIGGKEWTFEEFVGVEEFEEEE